MTKMLRGAVAALLALLLPALCACGGGGGKKQGTVQQIYDDIAAGADLPAMMTVRDQVIMDTWGVDVADCDQYLFMIYDGDEMLTDEIALVVAKDADAADAIEEKLKTRLERKSDESAGYLPEQYEIAKKGKVLRDGLRVALLVSRDIDNVLKVYEQYE